MKLTPLKILMKVEKLFNGSSPHTCKNHTIQTQEISKSLSLIFFGIGGLSIVTYLSITFIIQGFF